MPRQWAQAGGRFLFGQSIRYPPLADRRQAGFGMPAGVGGGFGRRHGRGGRRWPAAAAEAGVPGRIDHLAYNPATQRLFVAALFNWMVEAIFLNPGQKASRFE